MSICKAPFATITLDQDLSIKPCCVSDEVLGQFQIPSDISKAFAGEKLSKIRKQFTKGEFPGTCESCTRSFKSGRVSKKERFDRRLGRYNLKESESHLVIDELRILEINFSNLCNLDCVFCSSFFSSKWMQRDAELLEKGLRDQQDVSLQINTLPVSDKGAWVELIESAISLDLIEVNGGEPTIIKEFYELLGAFEQSRSPATMSVTTNGTQVKSRLVPFLESEKKLQCCFSIDGVGELYEFIRGVSFSKIEENIAAYINAKQSLDLNIIFTICNLNILGILDFCHWVDSLIKDYPGLHPQIRFDNQITNPTYLSPWVLPESARQEAISHIESVESKGFSFVVASELESLRKYILSHTKSESEKQLRRLKQFMPYHQKARQIKVSEIVPWWEEI